MTAGEMKLSPHYVGTLVKPVHRDIHWRECMNYAAATDDLNPVYFDDESSDGIIAPPMFAVAVTWPVIERLPEFIDSDDFPVDLLATMVHYTEHLVFYRPIRPGDRLTVSGSVVAILPHRSGTRVILRFDVKDSVNAPVFQEYIGALLRGVSCDGEAVGKENLPAALSRKDTSDPVWETSVFVDPLRPYTYDGCTGITFPIHTSIAFARMVGLPGIVLQGTATLAFAIREMINREAGGNPLRLCELGCRFTSMVRPGTEIRIRLDEKRSGQNGTGLFFTVFNEESRSVIRDGYALMKESAV